VSSSVTNMWCKMIDSDFCNCHLGDDSNPKPYEGQLAASFKHLEHSKPLGWWLIGIEPLLGPLGTTKGPGFKGSRSEE
jgi:hypothetical protein